MGKMDHTRAKGPAKPADEPPAKSRKSGKDIRLSRQASPPFWLEASVQDKPLLPLVQQIAYALHLPQDGKGAAGALEVAGHAFAARAQSTGLQPHRSTADLLLQVAARARAELVRAPLMADQAEHDSNSPMAMLARLLERHGDDAPASHGALVGLSYLIEQALRDKGRISRHELQRLVSMAGACRASSDHAHRERWRTLSKLSPFSEQTLGKFIEDNAEGQPTALARALRQAVNDTRPIALPLPIAREDFEVRVSPGAADAALGTEAEAFALPDDCRPSQAAQKAAASHAGMAECFGLPLDHDRNEFTQQTTIAKACSAALRRKTHSDESYLALLQTLAWRLNSGHKKTLGLALQPDEGDGIWYCPELRHVLRDRRGRRKLTNLEAPPEWELLFIPPEASDFIAELLFEVPSARRLHELIPREVLAGLVPRTQAWVKRHADPAHPATPGRAVHSAGLAYLHMGATDVQASERSLSPALAAESAHNYYAPTVEEQHELDARVFKAVGYEVPALPDGSGWVSPPDVPTDDDMRSEWRALRSVIQAAFRAIDDGDVWQVAEAATKGTGACRKAFELLTGARNQMRQNPTVGDVSVHQQFYFLSDKPLRAKRGKDQPRKRRSRLSSDRILPQTDALRDVLRVTRLLGERAHARLRTLGVPEPEIPPQLARDHGSCLLFSELVAIPSCNGPRLATRVLDGRLGGVEQVWRGPLNMGRRYWATQASRSREWMVGRVLGGRGRGLYHTGSQCLAVSVRRLLEGCSRLMGTTLERLALPAFGEGIEGTPRAVTLPIDLRAVDQRKPVDTRATDMPAHHAERRSLGFVITVERLQGLVGKHGGISPAARALLSLMVCDGLCHAEDVRAAWAVLPGCCGHKGTAWIAWVRGSGQPIEVPLMEPTRIAAEEVAQWPTLDEAEQELNTWLQTQPGADPRTPVIWPRKRNATITALCWMQAHVVRLSVAPFLSLACRPDVQAATLDRHSLDVLQGKHQGGKASGQLGFRERVSRIVPGTLDDPLAWIQSTLGEASESTDKLGEKQARSGLACEYLEEEAAAQIFTATETANAVADLVSTLGSTAREEVWRAQAEKVQRKLLAKAAREWMPGEACCVLDWLDDEARATRVRAAGCIAPGTWYDYLSSVRVYLAAAWPLGRRPDQLTPTEWRRLTTRVLQARPGDTETTTEARHKAWRRILLVLTCRTAYKAAEEALRDTQIARPARRYVPAAASTLWPAHMLPRICAAVDHAFRDEPLLGPQARALVMLLTDAGMRRSEAGGTRLRDLARDGSWIVRMTSGFGRRKVPLATGISPLSLQAGETLLSLKQLLGDPHDGPDYFLAQRGHSVNLAYALALYDEVVSIAREVVGSQALQGHGTRGSAAMRKLAGKWETAYMRLAQQPFALSDAQAIVRAMEGDGPTHLASVVAGLSHASHRTFVRRYCTAWPLLYAASMRARLENVDLDAPVIRALPHVRNDPKLGTKAVNLRRRYVCDAMQAGRTADLWAWCARHRYPAVKQMQRKQEGLAQSDVNPVAASAFKDRVHYVVRRALGGHYIASCLDTGLVDREAALLEPVVACVKAAVPSLLAAAKVPKPKARTHLLGVLASADGQALQASILAAGQDREDLQDLLWDSAAGKLITAERVERLLRHLPLSLGFEAGFSTEYRDDVLEKALDAMPRVLVDYACSVERTRPRMRVMPLVLTCNGRAHPRATPGLTTLALAALAACFEIKEVLT